MSDPGSLAEPPKPASQAAATPAPPAASEATEAAQPAPPARSASARSAEALDAAVTRLGFDDELQRMARLAAAIPGIERLSNRKLADFAASRDSPTIARQLFEGLPPDIQGPLGTLTLDDFIKKYGGRA